MKKIAVFASGSGSNYEAIMEAFHSLDSQQVEVSLLVCDKPQAYVIERAQKWATPTFVISAKEYESKEAFESVILKELEKANIDFIVLAGYMRLLGSTLLQAYMGRILNIHPSLLPAFPGKDALGQALEYGVKVTGITIHFVDEGMDTGPIVLQDTVTIDLHETNASLAQKIQKLEHQHYPATILQCVTGEIVMEERKVKWVQKSNEL